MKRLYILRHGKAEAQRSPKHDLTRDLTKKGKNDVKDIVGTFAKKKKRVDCIISSRAERARKTASLLAKKMGYPEKKILIEDSLYPASEPTPLLQFLSGCDAAWESVCVVGHAPQLEDAVKLLADTLLDPLAPAGLVGLEFDAPTWDEALTKKGTVIYGDSPETRSRAAEVLTRNVAYVREKVAGAVTACLTDLSPAPNKKTAAVIKKSARQIAEAYCAKLPPARSLGAEAAGPDRNPRPEGPIRG